MRNHKVIIWMTVLALLFVLSGCAGNQEASTESDVTTPTAQETSSPERKLQFSVVVDESVGYTQFFKEDLGGKTDVDLLYANLTEVNIKWNGEDVALSEAIAEEMVTVPEIFAFARIDAQNGFCREVYTSEHGLTHFWYIYPECELRIAYDVYETPNNEPMLINELHIYNITDSTRSVSDYYVDEESEWGYFMDREDWGLTFEVTSVSPTQITVNYTQQEGQEIGELSVTDFSLYSRNDIGILDEYIGRFNFEMEALPIDIQSDGSGQITFDWTDIVGALEPGEYYVKATVTDNYDESDFHPLMVNYYDKQSYHIVFTIE